MNVRLLPLIILLILIPGVFSLGKYSAALYREKSKSPIPLPSTHPTFSPEQYSVADLVELQKNPDVVVLDVRGKKEYDLGHIPGAVHVDYYDADALAAAAKDKIPITYCTYSTWRSPYAAYLLHKQGIGVGILHEGITGWNQEMGKETFDTTTYVARHPIPQYPPLPSITMIPTGSVSFTLDASQWQFTPSRLEVKKGQKVVLNIKSSDVPHGFVLPHFGIKEEILPGQTKHIEFVADRAGTFPFVCSVECGHGHPSMVGELIVQ